MAYRSGDLSVETLQDYLDQYGEPDEGEAPHISDSRTHAAALIHPYVYLPHSCDRWVIGGPMEVRALIHDLEKILRTMENL